MIVELLKTRFSVRRFQDRPVPEAVLQDILEAGRLSPSGGNEQPWAFGYPEQGREPRPKKGLDEITFYNTVE